MNIFAVVCHGNAKGLLDISKEYGAKCSCLYNEPIDPGVFKAAPFLVEINEAIKPWFAELTDPWGIYLITEKEVSFNEMRKHLRRFTYVKIPSQEVPVMFRFYDPRVFWNFTEVIDDIQLNWLLGKIELVASNYQEYRQSSFDGRRELYRDSKMKGGYLTLSLEQEAAFNRYYQNKFEDQLFQYMFERMEIKDFISDDDGLQMHLDMLYHELTQGKEITHPLDQKMLAGYDGNKRDFQKKYEEDVLALSRSINQFCLDHEIYDGLLIKGISLLFIREKILFFDDFPERWKQKLARNKNSGTYRARMLLFDEFGTLKNI